ncbi:hypothetical protein Acr_24g0010760 [Actinidia rufa]|uniref:Putative zinc-finger domain-containing protein n=1 Tax=Actinidia rufa TaxID=165716 RepID=A0A7J0GVS3_9ERIC|nr:hypothetical protein Acr_24g0010760 [Actinidia rufa]
MEESNELGTKAVASVSAIESPSHEVGNNLSHSREEGELSSSDDDVILCRNPNPSTAVTQSAISSIDRFGSFMRYYCYSLLAYDCTRVLLLMELRAGSASDLNISSVAQEETVPVASFNKIGVKEGRRVSTGNPKSFVDIPSGTSAQLNYQKGTEKNRAPFVPFVISFSDDDSGSDSEEIKRSQALETKGNALGVDANRRPPASLLPKSQTLQRTTKVEARLMPKKLSLGRTFVSSITKINGANSKNGGRPLTEQRSRVRNFNAPNNRLVGQEHGVNQKTHLSSSKLQDLRQQIAIRENELKLKSAQQNKEIVSGSSRDYNTTDSDNDTARKRRATSADFVPREKRDPEKKRLKLSDPHKSQLISNVPSGNSLMEDGGQQRINERIHRDKEIPLGKMHAGAAQQKKQDDTRHLLSGSRSTGVKGCAGADVFGGGSKCDRNTKLVDPSISLKQPERIVNSSAKNFPKGSSTVELKHSIGSKLPEVRSSEKANKPISNAKHLACSLRVPASDMGTSDVSLNNASLCNCLGTLSISQDENINMQSFLDMEELQDKELEVAQEHRLKCEIEERNALKSLSDLNELADEDEDEETFPLDYKSVKSGHYCQGKEERYGQRAKDINGTKTLSKKSGLIHNTDSADVTVVEHGGSAGQAEMNLGNEGQFMNCYYMVSAVWSAVKVLTSKKRLYPSFPFTTMRAMLKTSSSNYASPTAEPSDGCFSAEEPVHLVGLQSIDNEVGNSVRSVEIQPSILSSVSMDKTSMNICAGKVGCYTCHLAIDPFWPLCMFELRGKCNNDECPWQHVKDYSCKNMSLENSDSTDCQVGSLTHKAKFCGATSTSKDNDGLDLATPTYIDLCWQKCFSSSLAISTLLPSDLPTEEPFLHGTQARTEGQLDQRFADSDQSLEMALLNLHHEVNKRKGSEKSIGKDDMFHSAVEHNEGSYELWLMYINSRIQLKDRLVAYDNALLALCRHASAADCDTVHASACILDLFLQLVNCLCISGNADKAIEKINGIFPFTKNSDGPHPLLLSSILPCLTLYEKCIFWLSCVYILVYRKLPNAIVQQFECEKEISEMEWPSVHLTGDAKQQAVKLIEMAVDSLALYIYSQSLESESTLKAAHVFAVNHIRCIAVLEGLECSRSLLAKYTKLYPSCLELVLMLGRMWEDDFVDSSFVGFKEALSNWPEDVPGVQCIWNQYAECVLQNGKYDFAKELMNQWFHSVWEVQHSRCEEDSLEEENSHSVCSLDLASGFNLDAWVSNSSEIDAVFGLLNLSLYKLLQNDLSEARLAIDRALKAAAAENYKHCVREHAMFLLSNDSHFKEGTSSGILSILKGYLVDPRAFPTCQPLSRKFIQSIKKPRVRQLVSNIWSVVSSDFSIINLVLGVCFGPSLLPQTFSKLKDLVDFVEAIMEILPSNYQLAMSICKLLGKCSNPTDVTNASVSFWASSLLVNALFQAVPVAAEYVWVEAAGVLHNLTEIQSISGSFHRRALSVYPFSLGLWKSYLNLSRITGNTGSVIEAARERGIKLESTL